jgi:phosphoenolpyruvate carboxykinase (ATP)
VALERRDRPRSQPPARRLPHRSTADETRWGRLSQLPRAHRNLGLAALYEQALRREEGVLAASGALVVDTGEHTGRSPKDKFVVEEPESADEVWWGEVNQPLAPDSFGRLRDDVRRYLKQREVFVQDLSACAEPTFRLPVRVESELAWTALFSRNLFIVREGGGARPSAPFTVLHAPLLRADPARHGTASETVIAVSLAERQVVIAGTRYAGEIKKSIFSVLQFLLPQQGVATMHCSCNAGPNGESALFFGLSGTGKTTLSTEPGRTLIGDDEHGWSDEGIFNFEGGSYAKVINLSAEAEPAIFAASHRFGTVLENVAVDPRTRELDLADDSKTENTRAAFPLSFIPGASTIGLADHPRHVIFLTADAFGVLPPVARLTPEQAAYYYLAGYTSKLAGTERGVTEPEATFSPCFGGAFLTLPPVRYAELLGERIARHRPSLWLVNTGWTGGPYGVGRRIAIADTRAIVRAILDGALDDAPTEADEVFGLRRVARCPDVSPETLDPRATWDNPASYDETARRLAGEFRTNMAEMAGEIPETVLSAGPAR